tara:strand:+ start:104 stop:505 length:402 start_codon:yes stop_codon:yes gene_type:complete
MVRYSPQISNFFQQTGIDSQEDVKMVPKSHSCATAGDFIFFRYKLGVGMGSREERLFLLLEPITRDAKTGNELLTGIRVPLPGEYSPGSLVNLYKNKELPPENYRTYILSKIYGPLRKIDKGQAIVRYLRNRG